MTKHILLSFAALLFGICLSAQSHWTLAVGMDNTILCGANQHSYLGGARLGFDYRYDFRNGKGVGLETGLYMSGTGRRYRDRDITGGQVPFEDNRYIADSHGNLYCVDQHGELIGRSLQHSDIANWSMLLPVHLTYTHLFYQDWSLTVFLGPTLNVSLLQNISATYLNTYQDGYTALGVNRFPCPMIDLPIEFGLGFSYRHCQLKVGTSLPLLNGYSELILDGSTYAEHNSKSLDEQSCFPVGLWITCGYRF